MAEELQRELERFFAEAGPRLEAARALDGELDRQLARRFNVFRYLRTDEMGFSRMVADLLDPLGDHGQGTTFLQLLTEKLCFAKGVDLGNALVQTERQIDGRRLDISVEIDRRHCLAIENKSNFAGDQERQVQDYLDWLERYDHSLLVYLSPDGAGPSTDSVTKETVEELKRKTPRSFVIMPCGPSALSDDGFDSLRLTHSLVDWLADCRRACDVDRLRWYLREAETYCQRTYGGNAVTDSEKSEIAKFVRGDDKNVATALAVYKTWPEVALEIKRQFLELIKKRLKSEIGHMVWDGHYGGGRFEGHIKGRRSCWRPYVINGQNCYTELYMEEDPNGGWGIGVGDPDAHGAVSNDEQERIKELREKMGALGQNQSKWWLCWKWVDDKYRDWNAIVPELNAELRRAELGDDRGEIASYFVREFKELADLTVEEIDSIDGR